MATKQNSVNIFYNLFEKIKKLLSVVDPKLEEFYKLSNMYYEISYVISAISLIIVYFFYLLSFIFAFMGIDIWYGTSTLIFIIGLILHFTITLMQFLNGYTLPDIREFKNVYLVSIFVRIFNDLISIISNIIIILPVIISISLIIAISLIHYGPVTKTITDSFVGALKGFGIVVGAACAVMLISRGISQINKLDIFSFFIKLSTAIITVFLTTIIIVFFSGLMHKLISEIYTYTLKCDETSDDVCPHIDSSGNYSSLYQQKIRPFFVFNDTEIDLNDKKNKFWFISLLIHFLIVSVLLIYFFFIINYKQFNALNAIRDLIDTTIKDFCEKNFNIGTYDTGKPSSGGSKIKSKRK